MRLHVSLHVHLTGEILPAESAVLVFRRFGRSRIRGLVVFGAVAQLVLLVNAHDVALHVVMVPETLVAVGAFVLELPIGGMCLQVSPHGRSAQEDFIAHGTDLIVGVLFPLSFSCRVFILVREHSLQL